MGVGDVGGGVGRGCDSVKTHNQLIYLPNAETSHYNHLRSKQTVLHTACFTHKEYTLH